MGQLVIPRVAVIGCGYWGPNLVKNFHNKPASEVLWVVDSDAARLKITGERFPGVRLSGCFGSSLTGEAASAGAA